MKKEEGERKKDRPPWEGSTFYVMLMTGMIKTYCRLTAFFLSFLLCLAPFLLFRMCLLRFPLILTD